MKVYVLLFGNLVDIVKVNKINIELSDSITDTALLKNYLKEKYSKLTGLNYLLSVNQHIIRENKAIYDGDEIALLPPFSGG